MTDQDQALPARQDAFVIYKAVTQVVAREPNPNAGGLETNKSIAVSMAFATTAEEAVKMNAEVPGVYAVLACDAPLDDVLRVTAVAQAGILGQLFVMVGRALSAAAAGGPPADFDPRVVGARRGH